MASNYEGTIRVKDFAKGSKSEHKGIALETAAGEVFFLRLKNGNPFLPKEDFKAFLGKVVTLTAEPMGGSSNILEVADLRDITIKSCGACRCNKAKNGKGLKGP